MRVKDKFSGDDYGFWVAKSEKEQQEQEEKKQDSIAAQQPTKEQFIIFTGLTKDTKSLTLLKR